jgi:hypothetical protein
MLPEALTIGTYICLFDEKRPDIREILVGIDRFDFWG